MYTAVLFETRTSFAHRNISHQHHTTKSPCGLTVRHTSLHSVWATPTLIPPQRESVLPPKIEDLKIYITTVFIYNTKITSYIKLINIIFLII